MAVPLTTPPTLTAKDIERFWSHVDQSSPDGCWPWMLGRDKDGYGKFKAQQRNLRAHRVAIFIVTGEWGEVGMHDCDNPPCCRVGTGHARPGSDAENRADMVRKGRGTIGERNGHYTHPECTARGERHGSVTHPERLARGDANGSRKHPESLARGDANGSRLHPELLRRGETHGNAKLTEADVRAIRIERAEGATLMAIGEHFGVSFSLIYNIVKFRAWKHVK